MVEVLIPCAIVQHGGAVDGLEHLLSGPRARQAFLLQMMMEPPWGVRIEDDPALTLLTVARGSTWITGELGEPLQLREGDVAVVRGGPVYTVADHPSTRPRVTIEKGNVCVDPDGQLLDQRMALGVRTWGNSHDGSDVLLVGTWEAETEAAGRSSPRCRPSSYGDAGTGTRRWSTSWRASSCARTPGRRWSSTGCWTCCSSPSCGPGWRKRRR